MIPARFAAQPEPTIPVGGPGTFISPTPGPRRPSWLEYEHAGINAVIHADWAELNVDDGNWLEHLSRCPACQRENALVGESHAEGACCEVEFDTASWPFPPISSPASVFYTGSKPRQFPAPRTVPDAIRESAQLRFLAEAEIPARTEPEPLVLVEKTHVPLATKQPAPSVVHEPKPPRPPAPPRLTTQPSSPCLKTLPWWNVSP